MDVAFASSTGVFVDRPFQKTVRYSVWHVSADESCYAYTVPITEPFGDHDGRISTRAEALKQCTLVCSTDISGPAAAKLAVRNVHHLRTNSAVPVEELIGRLQVMLRDNPAPWLRKSECTQVPVD